MSDIRGALSYFAGQQSGDTFDNPFNSSPENDKKTSVTAIQSVIDEVDERKREKKKKKKDKFTAIMEKGNDLLSDFTDDDTIGEFDDYLSSFFCEDEDVSVRNNLISLGRKYARDTRVSGEASEITKAYSGSEKTLNNILKDVEKDSNDVQKDIDTMRISRTRNYKTLSELVEVKAQLHNTRLSVVKELNNMKKTQFDLQYKADKTKADELNNDMASNRSLQQLFSLGRNNIISSVGGYGAVGGAITDDSSSHNYSDNYNADEDAAIQKRYFSDDSDTRESDGDKFLKYENLGVEYVLILGEDDSKTIIAEDKDGNIIPDYPMPTDVNSLDFSISEQTGVAIDNYNRQYKLRQY